MLQAVISPELSGVTLLPCCATCHAAALLQQPCLSSANLSLASNSLLLQEQSHSGMEHAWSLPSMLAVSICRILSYC